MTGVDDSVKNCQTNDELVEGIINDFKSSCATDVEGKESFGDTNCEKSLCDENSSEAGPSSPVQVDDTVEEKTEKKREDFIDEEELAEKEKSYNEEDRLRLKADAEELKRKGNQLFKDKEFKVSAECYTLGLRTCPLSYPKERAVLYANRAAAKINMSEEEPALEDCNKSIELDPSYVRALLRRARLQETMDHLDEALEDFKKLLEMDPSNKDAIIACQRLPPLIHERNEKMKTEMIGKLKDLGNVFLRPFGLSTDYFHMVQDPNTGGYSFKFQQNS